ncbi:ABC transporter permease [Alteromonas pelagimontana]|uniref:ABC transporter permease n=1 Tax=Alteromonas pelagimontana TaxID=1858656 RepID=A0A6M4MEP7_9ALTE|nr:ABC transporter permease [Alteromonas pelagimontana]QJR80646.1 ABC transporter permease [Alteromonas pelagimontana]
MIFTIAAASLKNRWVSVLLTLISIIISVSLLLSVEFIRSQVRESFTRTVSDVDMIVGARTGQLNLLLYSVFRIGNATNGISWDSVSQLTSQPNVKWYIPLSLGDAHKGFRVVGTNNDYFKHFKYGNKQSLNFADGDEFIDDYSAVLGSEVAAELNYTIGSKIVISHGLGKVSFTHHDTHPFTVVGILAPTGTPVDKAVHVTLHGIEAAHEHGTLPSFHRQGEEAASTSAEEKGDSHTLSTSPPEKITALLLGLENRIAALQVQQIVNQYKAEPLLAILPGVALAQLWQLMGNVEKLLRGISLLILFSSLIGLMTMLLASMRERRHEIALLRAVGAGSLTILWLVQAEALIITISGCALSFALVSGLLHIFSSLLNQQYGLFLTGNLFTSTSAIVVLSVIAATWLCSFVPAIAAYKQALHTGLNQR